MSVQCVGQLLIRPMYFAKAGDKRDWHGHTFDHITAIWTGGLRANINNRDGSRHRDSGDYYAPKNGMKGVHARPCLINIPHDCDHELIALEDHTHAGCMYFHRDPDSKEVIPEFNGWIEAAS